MNNTRIRAALVTGVATAGLFVSGAAITAPAANASGNCDQSQQTRITSHSERFTVVGTSKLINTKPGTATLSVQVGATHTTAVTYSASVTVSAEASFFGFAKASASATAGVSLAKTATMTKTFTATATVPGKTTRTVQFGFSRYRTNIQHYHLYQQGTCKIHVDGNYAVDAPYATTFRIS